MGEGGGESSWGYGPGEPSIRVLLTGSSKNTPEGCRRQAEGAGLGWTPALSQEARCRPWSDKIVDVTRDGGRKEADGHSWGGLLMPRQDRLLLSKKEWGIRENH